MFAMSGCGAAMRYLESRVWGLNGSSYRKGWESGWVDSRHCRTDFCSFHHAVAFQPRRHQRRNRREPHHLPPLLRQYMAGEVVPRVTPEGRLSCSRCLISRSQPAVERVVVPFVGRLALGLRQNASSGFSGSSMT
jgi:hypothetical protein